LVKFDFMMNQVLRRVQSLWVILSVRMAMYLLAVFMWVHMSATAWYWLGTINEDGWTSLREDIRTSFWLDYFIAFHWAASQLQGNVDVYPILPMERAFASCQLLASVVVLALLVSKLTTVMQEMQEIKVAERRLLNASQLYLQEHRISPQLAFSVRNYLQRKQAVDARHSHNRDEIELFRVLPAALRRSLLEEARAPTLLAHVLFTAVKHCNGRLFERLCCDLLYSKTVHPDDHIFSVAVHCLHVYFVVAGETAYFAYTRVASALMTGQVRMPTSSSRIVADRQKKLQRVVDEGACLCEAAIWVRWVHRGDFEAISQASLLLLDVNAFAELVASYPTVKISMRDHAARWVRKLHKTDALTDLLSTADAMRTEHCHLHSCMHR